MKIEISGHTDKTGSEPINFKLSEDRAKAVVEYLVQKGIDRSRMEYKGFGSLQPIADNATSQGELKTEELSLKSLNSDNRQIFKRILFDLLCRLLSSRM